MGQQAATLQNGATWNATTQDGSASCLDLDGVNDHASAPHDPKHFLTNSFAVLFRFKSKSTSQTSKYVLSKPNAANTDNLWGVPYEYVNDLVEFYASGYSGSNPRTSSGLSVADTNWHAFGWRYNGTEWAKWLDGTKTVISSSITFSLATGGTQPLYFGSFNGGGQFSAACIDDVLIYRDNLPTDAEIAAWQTSYTLPSSVAPVARYEFNEGTGTTAADSGVPAAYLTASTTSIAENGGTASVIALLNQTASATVTVALAMGGSATTNSDYTTSGTSISITSGNTSGSISVTAIQDAVYEGNESLTIEISAVSGALAIEAGTQSRTITIVDDDLPLVSLLLLGSPIAENGGVATVAGLLSATHSANVTVNLAFSGTATTTSDYTATSTSFNILSGQTSGSITITAVNDASAEGHETVVVDISSVTNGTENGTQQVTLTILDDETKPSVGFQVSSATVSESASTYNVVCVLTNPFTQSGNITVLLGGGTATQLEDYSGSFAAGSVTMSFAVGSTSASSSVSIVNDNKWEPDETLPLAFNTASFVPLGVFDVGPISTSTVTITNDDPSPTLSISASQTTMSENAGTAQIFAFLTNPLQSSSIVYLNYGGTATRNVDYTRSAASPVAVESMGQTLLIIAAGTTSASITLLGMDDASFEANETIVVSIASISYGDYNLPATPIQTGTTAATVSIVSDDTVSGSGLSALSGLSGLSIIQ